jgi:DNA primase
VSGAAGGAITSAAMGIVDEDVARVRDTTDLVALISEQVALRRVGQRYVGLCPFHQEKTPSFSVNPTMNLWHCFGCQKSGDAITFLRETEHLDFPDAVERLAQRAGITLRYDDRKQAKDKSRKTRLAEAVGAAIDFYHRLLLESPEGGTARKYLRGRGFDGDAARQFLLGWSPEGWDGLSRWLQQERKFSRDDIVGAGLGFVNKANRLQDQFRSRLMFPIHDARGEPVGFGGRALTDEGPKYKNSPENPLYQKSRLLYGLHRAKAEIVAKDEVVICEGYTDVMAFALAGVPNAVATCGTAVTNDHVRALKNLGRGVVLAYDTDSAGQAAAEQWYRWEHEYELRVRVADLPAGSDPGDLWRDDQARLLASIEKAQPFLRFRLDRALASSDLATNEGRGRAAEHAAAIVAEHPSELVRDQYVMELAGRLGIDADGLRAAVTQARRAPAPRNQAGRTTPSPSSALPDDSDAPPAPPAPVAVDPRELDLLRWVIHEPELVADWLDETLILDPVARETYDLLVSAHDFHEALATARDPVRELLERLAVEEPDPGDELTNLQARLLVNTVEHVAKRALAKLVSEDDEQATTVNSALDVLVHGREIGDWVSAQGAAERLLAWLREERAGSSTLPPTERPAELVE